MALNLAILLVAVPLVAAGSFSEFEIPKWLAASVGAAIGVGLLLRSRNGRRERTGTSIVLLMATVMVFASLVVASSRNLTWTDTMLESVRLFVPLVLAVVAANARLEGRGELLVMLAGAFAPAFALLADILLHAFPDATSIPHARDHFTATLGNTAHLGEMAVMALPFIGLLWADRRRVLALGALATVAWVAYRADSRGAGRLLPGTVHQLAVDPRARVARD